MGRQCAKGNIEKNKQYIGDLNGYLKKIESSLETLEYDKRNGTIKIVGTKIENCYCPFVDKSKMTREFCNCTKGWHKGTFESIIGKPVDVKIDALILRGDERCCFTVTYK